MKFSGAGLLLGSCFALLAVACASHRHVSDEYNEIFQGSAQETSKRTVLVFLVDGLPILTLREALGAGRLPQIKRFFLGSKEQFNIARSPFPSLTFSGVGALLTEKPTDQNGLFGNKILDQGKVVDFESPVNLPRLNQMIEGNNIFSRLRAKGLKTVSIDYAFTADSDAHMEVRDSEAAVAILEKNYAKVDTKLIGSLRDLLEKTDSKKWPDFIFVHLLGVDFLSHDHGPKSLVVKKYLEFLDRELGSAFQILERAETAKKREIVALMTSDHGFDEGVHKTLNLEQVLRMLDPRIEILNEGRYAGLYFPPSWSESRKSLLMKDLISHPQMDIVAHRQANQIYVQSHSQEIMISYEMSNCMESPFSISVFQIDNHLLKAAGSPVVCPEKLDGHLNQSFYPYFLSNLSHYFESVSHPDALIIPKPGVSFNNTGLGQHGGPTTQEVFVPLLMHNGVLGNDQQIPALWDLLKFL